jgi:hypothetical protein
MNNDFQRFEYSVRQLGCVASNILNDGKKGRVSALFENSFYVEMDDGLACIGHVGLDASPLNVITAAPGNMNWRASGACLDDTVSISANTIFVGNRFSFVMDDANRWSPARGPATWRAESLKPGLAAFRMACAGRVPLDGLGGFIEVDARLFDGRPVCRIAKNPIDGLYEGLMVALRDSDRKSMKGLQWIPRLIGMGPGLTPSGDDFIGGMMVALHGLGELEICRHLWAPARRCAIEAGNPIAMAHLEAAAEGLASAGIHRAMATIMAGGTGVTAETLVNIDRIGHTSGWDTMAGIVMVFDAWLQAQDL